MKPKPYNEAREKWCLECQQYHHVSDFGIDKSSKDGRYRICCKSRSNLRAKTNTIENDIDIVKKEYGDLKLIRDFTYNPMTL